MKRLAAARIENVQSTPRWKRVVLPQSAPLTKERRYFLHIPSSAGPAHPSGAPWKAFWHQFATRFEATIVDSPRSFESGEVLELRAGVAIQTGAGPATLILTKDGQPHTVPATFRVSVPSPIEPGAEVNDIGQVRITLADGRRLPVGKHKLTAGLESFGATRAPRARHVARD